MEYSVKEVKALVSDSLTSNVSIDTLFANQNTLLHIVSYYDLEDEVHLVLSRFPNLTIKNSSGLTAWEVALVRGNQAVLIKLRNFSIFKDYSLGVKSHAKLSFIDPPVLHENYIDWGYEKTNAYSKAFKQQVDTMAVQHRDAFETMNSQWQDHKKEILNVISRLTDAKNASYRDIYNSIEEERNFRQSIVQITETADVVKSIIASYKRNIFWGGFVEMRRYKGLFLSIWRQYACVISDESLFLYDVSESDMASSNFDIQLLHDSDKYNYQFRFYLKDIVKINCNDIQGLINNSNREPSVLKTSSNATRSMTFCYGKNTVYATNSNKEESRPEDCEITIEVNNFACFKSDCKDARRADVPVDDDAAIESQTGEGASIFDFGSEHSLGSLPTKATVETSRSSTSYTSRRESFSPQPRSSPRVRTPYKTVPLETIYIRMKDRQDGASGGNVGESDVCRESNQNTASYNDYASSVASSPAMTSIGNHLKNLEALKTISSDNNDTSSNESAAVIPDSLSSSFGRSGSSTNNPGSSSRYSNASGPALLSKTPFLSSSFPKSSINYMSTIGEEVDSLSNHILLDNLTEQAQESGVTVQALLSVLSHESNHVGSATPSQTSPQMSSRSHNIEATFESGDFGGSLSSGNSAHGSKITDDNQEDSMNSGNRSLNSGNDINPTYSSSSYRLAYKSSLKGLIEAAIAVLNNSKVEYHSSTSTSPYSLIITNVGTSGGNNVGTSKSWGGLAYYDIIDNFENDDILLLSEAGRESISSIHIEDFLSAGSGGTGGLGASEGFSSGKLLHMAHGINAFVKKSILGVGSLGASTSRNSLSIASRIVGAITGNNVAAGNSSGSDSSGSGSLAKLSGNSGGSRDTSASSLNSSEKLSEQTGGNDSILNRFSERTTLDTNNTNSVSTKSLTSYFSYNNYTDTILINNSKDTMRIFHQIVKMNKLLEETRHKRSYFESQLIYVIEMREKSLETIHYLQSLLVFCDNIKDNANAIVMGSGLSTSVGGASPMSRKADQHMAAHQVSASGQHDPSIFTIPISPKHLLEYYLDAAAILSSHYNVGIKLLQSFELLVESDRMRAAMADKLIKEKEDSKATNVLSPVKTDLYEIDLL